MKKKKRLVLLLALGVSFAPAIFAADITDDLVLSSTLVAAGQSRPAGTAAFGCPNRMADSDKSVSNSESSPTTQKAGTVKSVE